MKHSDAKIVTVTLTAVIRDGQATLLDANGKRLRRTDVSVLRPMSQLEVKRLVVRAKWHASIRGMVQQHCSKIAYKSQSQWDRKFVNWLKSVRMRNNRPYWRNKKQPSNRYTKETRPHWEAAVRCLLMQYDHRLHEHRKRKANPWRLWSQTVAGNHRKKGERHARQAIQKADGSSVGKEARRTSIQMQINWRRDDAGISVT
jgi:hypothetical protein